MESIGKVWARVPVIIRALVGGELLIIAGTAVMVLPVLGNFEFLPEVPWALPVTAAIAWLFWKFFSGSTGPAFSVESRRRLTRTDASRAYSLKLVTWYLACGLVMILSFRLLMPSLMEMSPRELPIDLQDYSLLTVIGVIASVALAAGLVEEVALRGYAQRLLEEQYGLTPAILIVGALFWFAHLNHDHITFAHVPFYVIVSAILGFAVYLTQSVVPAIIIHVVADLILIPTSAYKWPEVAGEMLSATPVWKTGMTTEFVVVALVFLAAVGATLAMGRQLQRDCLKP